MPLFSWFLNGLYALLIIAISPILIYRMIRQGKYRSGFKEKLLGKLPMREDSSRPCLWFHAVSVGEVLLLQSLLAKWEERNPHYEIVITTTTVTGMAVANEKFPQHHVCYFPLDFSWAVKQAIKRIRPSAILLVELELWPNFILAAHQARIPLGLVNGRISEKSFRGYQKIRLLLSRLLSRFNLLAAQNQIYAKRLIALGADKNKVHVTGSIKFDHLQSDRHNKETVALRQFFDIASHETVLIAGSTQAPEESIALDTWQELVKEFPHLRLILVPRHQERFEDVARLVQSRGLPLVRRSKKTASPLPTTSAHPPLLLLDTLGELAACWGLADIAFVGGSLTNRGGQNMIEPSAYGAAVMFGPDTRNFKEVVELLLSHQAAVRISDGKELTKVIRTFLAEPELAQQMGQKAFQLVSNQQGATTKTLQLIKQNLLSTNNTTPQNIDAA
ncbi:3-deoxy-D-manno-octulosonic acid transferase [hydrothermal vent metagenome]|uniref:lipid IVA 3-deoxy-D-manno-octulosonic acid transferase n=1 Tax=hydrothermal vent metagenome TaxID=652676 RepID=A0A3B1E113_9ZZZZ